MKLSSFPRKPLVIAMMTLPGAALAADAQATAAEQQLGAVVVTDTADTGYKAEKASSPKLTQPLKDLPRSVTVISESVIKDQGATTLRDVLRNVSGISMAAGEGGVPAGDNLTVRGFSARTDIFIDGVRDIGGYTRDPFNVGSVEVFKGPSSAYSGRGSTGGSINLVSKQPQRENFVAGSTGVGTDHYTRQTFDINQVLNDTAAMRLNLMYQDNDVAGRDDVSNRRWGVAPSLQLGQGTKTRTTLSLEHLEGDNTPDYGIPMLRQNSTPNGKPGRPAPVKYNYWYGLADGRYNYDETVTDIATVTIEHDLSEQQKLRQVFRYGHNDRDSRTTAPRFVSPTAANLQIKRELKTRDAQDDILISQTDLTSKFKLAGLQHTLVSGIEISRETSKNKSISMNSTMGGADQTTTYTPIGNKPNPYDDFLGIGGSGATKEPTVTSAKADTLAAYLFDTVAVNKHWDITAGARFDRYDTEYQTDTPTYTGTTVTSVKPAKFGQTDDMLSWNAGVVYKPVPAGSFYVAYGTSFNPSADGLTLSATTADVDPEESRTIEVGTKWSLLKNRLAVTAALFRTDKTNARTPDPIDPSNRPNVLDGEQRVDGAEIGVVGQVTPAWQVMASYTRLHSEVLKSNTKVSGVEVETGNELANVPKDSGTLWNTYQINAKWQVGGGVQYVSERYTSANDSSRHLVPSYTLWDAMVSYQLSRNVNLRLNGYNLTNDEHIGTVGGGHGIPGAGRSATMTASYQF